MPSVTLHVAASGDDGFAIGPVGSEIRTAATSVSIDQSFVSFGTTDTDAGFRRAVWVRFTGATPPQFAGIDSAVLTCTGQNGESSSVESVIEGFSEGNPAAPVSAADWNSRTFTAASVTWDFNDTWTDNLEFASPDIRAVIQEVVQHVDYRQGHAIMVAILDDLNTDSARRRSYESYDGVPAQATTLALTYTGGGTGYRYAPPATAGPTLVTGVPASPVTLSVGVPAGDDEYIYGV